MQKTMVFFGWCNIYDYYDITRFYVIFAENRVFLHQIPRKVSQYRFIYCLTLFMTIELNKFALTPYGLHWCEWDRTYTFALRLRVCVVCTHTKWVIDSSNVWWNDEQTPNFTHKIIFTIIMTSTDCICVYACVIFDDCEAFYL